MEERRCRREFDEHRTGRGDSVEQFGEVPTLVRRKKKSRRWEIDPLKICSLAGETRSQRWNIFFFLGKDVPVDSTFPVYHYPSVSVPNRSTN